MILEVNFMKKDADKAQNIKKDETPKSKATEKTDEDSPYND